MRETRGETMTQGEPQDVRALAETMARIEEWIAQRPSLGPPRLYRGVLKDDMETLLTAYLQAEQAVVTVDVCDAQGCGERKLSAREVVDRLQAKGIDVRVLVEAYDWTYDAEGQIHGLTAGDQGYEPTGLVVPDFGTCCEREEKRAAAAEQALRVPGAWVCNTCGFTAQKMMLRAADGAVGVDARDVQDICPNDGTSLRALTWREDAEASGRVAVELLERAVQAEQALTAEREVRAGAEAWAKEIEARADILRASLDEANAAKDATEARAEAAEARFDYEPAWRSAAARAEILQATLQNIRMVAARGRSFGHQATPQTPERMAARKDEALDAVLRLCAGAGVTSSLLRQPAALSPARPEGAR